VTQTRDFYKAPNPEGGTYSARGKFSKVKQKKGWEPHANRTGVGNLHIWPTKKLNVAHRLFLG